MESLEQIRERLLARFPDAALTVIANPGPAGQPSLLVGSPHAASIAAFLRDDPALRLDYCSNVTGVDWPDREVVETIKRTVPPPPPAAPADPSAPPVTPKVIEEKVKRHIPGYFEVVYHLYSMALKHGPVILRTRTADRTDPASLPSLTPIWRACEFQEREVYDLFGIRFTGHPDLRRILMWDEFKDYPMRKDYVEPDDYEWEPTPHGAVLDKARRHYPAPPESR
ncbi:MAG: NADH-quinone oxidoreductase subunit C [Verrucomicrobia bacterium]|nr:NADH-quinone oxidoreductase subunit C [Verrucomicrobiota bacterium]